VLTVPPRTQSPVAHRVHRGAGTRTGPRLTERAAGPSRGAPRRLMRAPGPPPCAPPR
jgi:hypothetical protein